MYNLVSYDMMKSFIPLQYYLKKRDDGEFAIVSNERQEIFYLNDTARTFYEMCDGKNSINSIISKMLMEYSVERNVLIADMIELIRNMQWQDIIIMREESC